MKQAEENAQKSQLAFLTFDGNYGGDKYEAWLCDKFRELGPVKKICAKRLGGLRTIKSLVKLVWLAYRDTSPFVIRPFGLPVFRRNMLVIFHHHDHFGMAWYSRFIESVDMIGLKISARLLNTKFLVVSTYWASWLKERNFNPEYVIFNQVDANHATADWECRKFLALKYDLDIDSKWVFLGGDQKKKGGRALLARWDLTHSQRAPYQFIFSGKADADVEDDSKTVWVAPEDYDKFLKQLHAVIANSQFDEGWCRVVHEAILSEVPAAGSGRGGMSELLSMAGYAESYGEEELIAFIRSPQTASKEDCQHVMLEIQQNNKREILRLAVWCGLAPATADRI